MGEFVASMQDIHPRVTICPKSICSHPHTFAPTGTWNIHSVLLGRDDAQRYLKHAVANAGEENPPGLFPAVNLLFSGGSIHKGMDMWCG